MIFFSKKFNIKKFDKIKNIMGELSEDTGTHKI